MSGIQGAMKSIRPYKSSEQYLYAMKEDLAEWLKELYDLEVDVGSFLEVLETGIWLCRHASSITQLAGEFRQRYPSLVHKLRLPTCGTTWNEFAQPGTFQARDNVSNFIQWCRKEMDIQEVLMFETEDLVLRKNEKNFVLCLLEVARRASRFGMSAPTLIQMEEEIENEIREDLNLPPEELLLPKPQRKPCSFKNLDQIVQCLVSHCTCPVQFSMIKVSEGKYRVGDSSTLIFVRILRNHVMVRVGGGWDTLQHYLDKHDPCRCTSLSHKQATKLASSPRTPVQHEITARFTPRMDNSNKPQPTLIVSRSQSPPPPVEWRSYAPFSLGPGRTVHASLPPSDSRTSGGVNRRCSDLQSSQVPQEPRRTPSSRVRERPVTPSQRVPAVELRSGPQPTNSTQSRREGYSSQQNGSAENGPHTSKTLQDHQRGRTTVAVQTMVTPPKEQRGGAHQPPGSTQKDGKSFKPNCVSHQAQHLGFPKAVKAPVGSSPMPPERGVTERGWRKGDPLVKRTSSPVKHVQQGYGEDHSAPTGVKVGPTSYRSQTPCQRDRVELRLSNGSLCVAKDSHQRPSGERVPQGEIGPFEEQNGPGEVLRSKRCCGEPTVQKERVYTPLPINPAEEQALYRSLEDEILSNIKELEADDNHKGCNGPLIPSMSGCNGSRPLIPSGQKPVCGDGVPRSGVYIPESVARWPPAGLHYDSVIQELSRALHQECGGTEKHRPALVNGNQAEKKVVEREGSGGKCVGIQPEGAAPSQPSQGELEDVHTKGGSPKETPNAASDSPVIVGVQGDTKPPPSKPRRSLKKPERVPSIYKLKLRPKIRPRRDNRPEKRPSKIPTPVFYGLAHRASSGKGQTKARNAKRQAHNCAAGSRQNKTGHIGGEEEATVSERSTSAARGRNSGEKMVVAGGKTELTDEDEAWV